MIVYCCVQATCVFENLDNGELMCAACPNAKVVITAGTSTVSTRALEDWPLQSLVKDEK